MLEGEWRWWSYEYVPRRRLSPLLSFFLWMLIFRASESSNNSCFRVSANHPDELRMKDLFLL